MTDENVHFSSDRDDWATPGKLVMHMSRIYQDRMGHQIMLDVCATSENKKAHYYIDGDETDALTADWSMMMQNIEHHGRHYYSGHGADGDQLPMAWMNPPYGRGIGKWVAKAHETGLTGRPVLALLPSRTDTRWYHDYVLQACDIWTFDGRIYFDGHDNAAPFPSMMALFMGEGGGTNHYTIDARPFRRRRAIEFGLRKIRVRRRDTTQNKDGQITAP